MPRYLLVCHQDWTWAIEGSHGGEYSNILFVDGRVTGLRYPWKANSAYVTSPESKILAAYNQ